MKKKKVVLLTAAACAGAAVIFARASRDAGTAAGPAGRPARAAVAVEAVPVRTDTIRSVKNFTGSLSPRSSFIAAAKVPGRLEKLFVDMGDVIERGQLLALLDDREYVQNLEQARAELEVAVANLAEAESARDMARREFERVSALRERGIASESALEAAEADYKSRDARYRVAGAQVRQREAALKAAELRLSFTRIEGSWEGEGGRRIIGHRYADEGSMLAANSPIVSVLDIDSLTAVIYVTEKDYYRVAAGDAVEITSDAAPGRRFPGSVARVSPALREASRAARVEVEVPNPGHRLKPGMFVRAEIELERRENAVVVPVAALTSRGGRRGVFLLDREKSEAVFVPVETGIVTAQKAEILSPEIDGSVVTLGQHLLDDGVPVIVSGAGSPAGGGR